MAVIKMVNFRLADNQGRPVTWAFIKAELQPDMTYADGFNTIFPKEALARTNDYGIATLYLYANDALTIPDSKYLITITKDGKTLKFLVRLTVDMPDSIDFEELLGRNAAAEKAQACKDPGKAEGHYFMRGGKVFI